MFKKNFPVIALSTVGIGLVLFHVFIKASNSRLQREVARINQRTEQLKDLTKYQQKIDAMNTEELATERANADKEVARLHQKAMDQVVQMRSESASRSAEIQGNQDPRTGLTKLEYFKNVGQATPANAVQTLFWAGLQGDSDTLAKLMVLDPNARKAADALLANSSQGNSRDAPLSADRLANLFLEKDLLASITAAKIISERYDTDGSATVVVEQPSGGREDIHLAQANGAWRMVVLPQMINRIGTQIRHK